MTKEDYKKELDIIQKNLEDTQIKALRYYQSYNILKNFWDDAIDRESFNDLDSINDVKKKLKKLIL